MVREIKLNERTNTPEVKRRIPKKIFDATQSINAAYAVFWGDVLAQPELADAWATISTCPDGTCGFHFSGKNKGQHL